MDGSADVAGVDGLMNDGNTSCGRASEDRLLSKSTFIAAYDCPVRLQHCRGGMTSTKKEDEFLQLLAEGGMQFECLVRAAYPGQKFEWNHADSRSCHGEAIEALRGALDVGNGVLHEPTFVSGPFSARVDMLRVKGKRIELCEIKAKSFSGPEGGWNDGELVPCSQKDEERDKAQIMGEKGGVLSSWIPYVADVGFQMVVFERALRDSGIDPNQFEIVPALVLVNKRAHCTEWDARPNIQFETVDHKTKDWEFVKAPPDGWISSLIVGVDVAQAVGELRDDSKSKAVRWKGMSLEAMMEDAAGIYCYGQSIDACTERGWKCRDCEYNGGGGERGGFDQCWGNGAASARNLTTLYHGASYDDPNGGKGGRWVHHRIVANRTDEPLTVAHLDNGLSGSARDLRRNMQMQAERAGEPVLGEGFHQCIKDELLPKTDEATLYFIDFETSGSCLPHYVGDRPYQVVPFQFSCHAVPVSCGVAQWDQTKHREWLFKYRDGLSSLGMDREFTEELERAVTTPVELSTDAKSMTDTSSSVFHWANHERGVLKDVRARLKAASDGIDDAKRIEFLDSMVGRSDQKTGGRLVDMLKVAECNVFHHLQKGRFSIKQFLPAICADEDIRSMVQELVKEAKDDGSVPKGAPWDPYKSLPPVGEVLGGDSREGVMGRDEAETLSSGTDAMTAFVALRYGADGTGKTWSEKEKEDVEKSLLTYCKLDTAAMVAVWRWIVEIAD